jgi:outer membrane biosynthesis protein TonB
MRWGWLLASLVLVGSASYFLYPAVESLTDREPSTTTVKASPVPAPAPKAAAPAGTEELIVNADVKPARVVAKTLTPAKPIRELAPVAADGIRNRITDEIPVYVTLSIGKNGSVVAAQAAASDDAIQSYLAQRAVEAVRQWKFQPARLGADAVPSKWTVRFRFDKSGVEWN